MSQLLFIHPKIWNVLPSRQSGMLFNHEDKSQLCTIMSPHLSCSLQNPGSEGGLFVGIKQQKEVAWQHLLNIKSVACSGNTRDWIIIGSNSELQVKILKIKVQKFDKAQLSCLCNIQSAAWFRISADNQGPVLTQWCSKINFEVKMGEKTRNLSVLAMFKDSTRPQAIPPQCCGKFRWKGKRLLSAAEQSSSRKRQDLIFVFQRSSRKEFSCQTAGDLLLPQKEEEGDRMYAEHPTDGHQNAPPSTASPGPNSDRYPRWQYCFSQGFH